MELLGTLATRYNVLQMESITRDLTNTALSNQIPSALLTNPAINIGRGDEVCGLMFPKSKERRLVEASILARPIRAHDFASQAP